MTAPSNFTTFQDVQPHDAHPSFGHLILLVFGAVLEVVCVSLPGYIIARLGYFDAEKQRFLADLNMMLFTPCLIFTKLASQLNPDKLADLGIIPIIFVIQTTISWLVSRGVAKCFGFGRRPRNFVTAMGVFGNSNSLPMSLVISLSQTLKGLHWDRIPGDTDDEVAARGILYLLVFQQLGQLARWTWGLKVLLAPKSAYEEYNDEAAEEGRCHEEAQNDGEIQCLLDGVDPSQETDELDRFVYQHRPDSPTHTDNAHSIYEPAGSTPIAGGSRASPNDSEDDEHGSVWKKKSLNGYGNTLGDDLQPHFFPRLRASDNPEPPEGIKSVLVRMRRAPGKVCARICQSISAVCCCVYDTLPWPLQVLISFCARIVRSVYSFLVWIMSPALWAMLIGVLVASVPKLHSIFFDEESFMRTSVTSAIQQTGGVAVPLILVVLGANLARGTEIHEEESEIDPEEKQIGTKLLVASLISRMLLCPLIMAPILALFAKYVPVSILDDPIFVIVCFLLTGAPSALQLAQICQSNRVYETVMSKILFHSYVIWIMPSTLILVVMAMEVVEWAATS